ncbi:MAG: aminotransferase class V-fold PLP-dependent enzyme [Candidatus Eremiobacteraeota bacterium]|uniref:Pyridoxal-dependent decarboxylase n=1 Tax=mine drainage metagenome TaxID=410659 RepID=E6PEM8_9ZZZZ|nr:aminotransferase class V-fold PLP-dependent enzyme [Candidatus Eremiobacteraeota bacterium]
MLDPHDWEAFRAAGHRALDDAIDFLRDVRERPAWQEMPESAKERLREALPREPSEFSEVYRTFVETILPYTGGNIHPRFFGWVQGTGTPSGAIAEMLAATMNANVGGRNHGAVYVERQVIAWSRDLFGFPPESTGVLTTGASEANLIGVLVARTRALGSEVREHGIDPQRARITGYASAATHGCVRRAFEIAGIGNEALRILPTDSRQRIDTVALVERIASDRASGSRPFLIVANAGTVDVGAIDPLDELATIARREGCHLHVDGAFGALAMLSETLRERLRGIERADSIAFDFHKWAHAPYDVGCVLVRDGEAHRATFASEGPYLTRMTRGLASATPWFTDYIPELSRSFRALKVWFTLKEQGADRIAAAIERNVEQASALGAAIDADPKLELLAPVRLNVVCFRYRPPGLDEAELDAFNDELVIRVQESGIAVVSSTSIGGKRALRACFVNHRTTEEDLGILLGGIRSLGESLARERG